ncbi:GNAT family N-acetyltransferase [Flavobacterium soli]|uniref:GNAT family N-acetyltransferase n=1 Tax=Flavobacterium soli TaxID=344881 RepID=UPI0003F7980E|nr:GNAT family N-acetyltransferase [Flavobacterium soli]
MNSSKNYIFTSERLGFRNWIESDIGKMVIINQNPNVMEFFPSILSLEETKNFIERMQEQFVANKYCYFAVDVLESDTFIGFIGLSDKDFESDFTPCVDIGWRLSENHWYKGYATEGAKACLNYEFNQLGIKEIVAIAPKINIKSEEVMKKIGMQKLENFDHPLLLNDNRLRECVCYSITF